MLFCCLLLLLVLLLVLVFASCSVVDADQRPNIVAAIR
jgi:hypothetical protein